MNKLLLYSSCLFFWAQATEITKKEGFVSQKLDSAQVSRTNGFDMMKDNEYLKINDCDVNHALHVLHHDHTPKNLEAFEQIRVSNNEHILKSQANLKGTTLKEADIGFWLSKLAVHAVAQTAYALIAGVTSLVYPPAAPIVYCSLQFTFAALVEIASNIVAYGVTIVLV